MINNRLLSRTAATSPRGGFTLVELLVVISIIAILASVALGPIMRGVKTAQHSSAMQGTRSLAMLEFQYGNDNGQTYPDGSKAEDIANLLLNGKYASDPKLFGISSTPGFKSYAGAQPFALEPANVTFDFMGMNTTTVPGPTGLTSNTADGTPAVWTTGGTYVPASTPGTYQTLLLDATKAPFGTDGVAVTYKSNSAQWLPSGGTLNGVAVDSKTVGNFVDSSYSDDLTGSYGVKKP